MVLNGEAQKLKVIVGEDDRVYQRPLFEAILFAAKKYKMAGVTVVIGQLSYGANSILNNSKVFTLSAERPVIIEMIDRAERIQSFAEIATKLLNKANCGGLIFAEEVHVFMYRNTQK